MASLMNTSKLKRKTKKQPISTHSPRLKSMGILQHQADPELGQRHCKKNYSNNMFHEQTCRNSKQNFSKLNPNRVLQKIL